jgi:hypothetical protein
MVRVSDETDCIAYHYQELNGRREMWAVRRAAPRPGLGEPAYPALFTTVGDSPGRIYPCTIGATPLDATRPLDRTAAVQLHAELVRRAETEEGWGEQDAGGVPGTAEGEMSHGRA